MTLLRFILWTNEIQQTAQPVGNCSHKTLSYKKKFWKTTPKTLSSLRPPGPEDQGTTFFRKVTIYQSQRNTGLESSATPRCELKI